MMATVSIDDNTLTVDDHRATVERIEDALARRP
jgi:hypothetical protein